MADHRKSIMEAFKSYPGIRHIYKALESDGFKGKRKALGFMQRANTCFCELKNIKNERKFIILSVYHNLKEGLYNDNILCKNNAEVDRKIKDEINGYLKHLYLKSYKQK